MDATTPPDSNADPLGPDPHEPEGHRPPDDDRPPPTSELLEELLDAFPDESVTVGDLLHKLERRAFGLLLLLLAIPNCIPTPPGLSTVFGVLMIAPAVQLILGRGELWAPRQMREIKISREALQGAIKAALPMLRRIERFVEPRWSFLTRSPFTIFMGFQTLIMAGVLILPIFLGNLPPGLTVAAMALALLQRDGRLALLSVPMAVVSVGIALVMSVATFRFFQEVLEVIVAFFRGLFGG